MRDLIAELLAPIMHKSGYRFSKDFRRGTTCYHRIIYRWLNTVLANELADINC